MWQGEPRKGVTHRSGDRYVPDGLERWRRRVRTSVGWPMFGLGRAGIIVVWW